MFLNFFHFQQKQQNGSTKGAARCREEAQIEEEKV